MKKPTDRSRVDPDGIRIVEKGNGRPPRANWAIGAVAIVIVGGLALRTAPWRSPSPTAPTGNVPAAAEARPDRSHAAQAASSHASRGTRTARAVPAPPSESHLAEQAEREIAEAARELAAATPERAEELTKEFPARAEEMLAAAREAGETTGLAAFPPPGTNPIKPGLVVPRDFDLPEGYIRYHQITDDGRRLEPILMFSPDYEFVDASGNPVEIPEDGVVPAEMAPQGLPLRALAVPKHPYGASLK